MAVHVPERPQAVHEAPAIGGTERAPEGLSAPPQRVDDSMPVQAACLGSGGRGTDGAHGAAQIAEA